MPFRARRDGEIVTPTQVDNRTAVLCPECGGPLYARGGENVARHFYHVTTEQRDTCAGERVGESATHARCVALAVAALDAQFGTLARQCGPEVQLDVSGTRTRPSSRRADALLEFEQDNAYFGRGIVVEVQHANHTKDLQATTHDYLAAGYSVVWLASRDFEEEHLAYEVIDRAFREPDGEGYSVREFAPAEFETRIGSEFAWEAPRWSCFHREEYGSHYWATMPAYVHVASNTTCVGVVTCVADTAGSAGGTDTTPRMSSHPKSPQGCLKML